MVLNQAGPKQNTNPSTLPVLQTMPQDCETAQNTWEGSLHRDRTNI